METYRTLPIIFSCINYIGVLNGKYGIKRIKKNCFSIMEYNDDNFQL